MVLIDGKRLEPLHTCIIACGVEPAHPQTPGRTLPGQPGTVQPDVRRLPPTTRLSGLLTASRDTVDLADECMDTCTMALLLPLLESMLCFCSTVRRMQTRLQQVSAFAAESCSNPRTDHIVYTEDHADNLRSQQELLPL